MSQHTACCSQRVCLCGLCTAAAAAAVDTFSAGGTYLRVDESLPVGGEALDEQVRVDRVAKVTLRVRQRLVAMTLKVVCQP